MLNSHTKKPRVNGLSDVVWDMAISQSESATQHIRYAPCANLLEMPLGTPRIATSCRQAVAHMPVPIP